MASYRYRAQTPARELGASINDLSADVLVYCKPAEEELDEARRAQDRGAKVIADFCDDHFDAHSHYEKFARTADAVTCPTREMTRRIPVLATVIPDPYEYPKVLPHCSGNKVLWFGHGVNIESLLRVMPKITAPLKVVSNVPWASPWSFEGMLREFLEADIVILPATAGYKSPNRALEAIRQGCFVVAEPHPSIENFPIWIGDINEGIEWASQNQAQANERTRLAQSYIERYSPRTVCDAWRDLLEKVKPGCTLAPVRATGTGG